MKFFLATFLILAPSFLAAATLTYTGDPLPVLLPLGQERRVEIEGARAIRVGLSNSLQERLEVESMGAHVWLTARAALASQRLYLETDVGSLILELRTDATAPKAALKIIIDSMPTPDSTAASPKRRAGYVVLTRHAIQALYAPEHRDVKLQGMRRVPIDPAPVALFRCRTVQPSACGDAVEALPHTAWEASPYYVTAVTVRNRLPQPLVLDPRDVRGAFATATLVHPRLGMAGSPQDTTTIVLISHVPFEHVL